MKGYFVVGTDTGVGKTAVGTYVARLWRKRGLAVGAAKPAETGCDPDPLDAIALAEAADDRRPLREICPVQFREALAPAVAASRAGKTIEPARMIGAVEAAARGRDRVLAEIAGGLLVPYADGFDAIDLVAASALPVLLVARLGLGTINHTRLSVEILRAREIKIAAVVISVGGEGTAPAIGDPAAETNPGVLAALLPGIPVVVFPVCDPANPPPIPALDALIV